MKNFRKVLSMVLVFVFVLSLAACGNKDDGKDAGKNTDGKATIKISWWGGDKRHTATQNAVKKFMELNPDIKVEMQYGAWDGWEKSMSTAFYTNSAPDVNQINWAWITDFSADGSKFKDLSKLTDLDLSQFDEAALKECTVADEVQAVPVSMTGRIFYWNKATFEQAGIAVPTSLAELKDAGATFKEKLGDEYYPLALGEYDRMILMVYYLESVYGKDWVKDGQLNYTAEEITKGLEFIKSLEEAHVTPTIETILGDGAQSLDKNPKWMEGKYAGIFEWDSSATKFQDALGKGNEGNFVVGNFFEDFGDHKGGFSKVSLAFAISETTKYPEACAKLLNFLLNEEEGVKIMASERGIPLSKKALAICKENNLLDPVVAEANEKVLSWTQFSLDTKFESSSLKSSDGVYYEAMQNLSYGESTAAEAADILVKGITKALAE